MLINGFSIYNKDSIIQQYCELNLHDLHERILRKNLPPNKKTNILILINNRSAIFEIVPAITICIVSETILYLILAYIDLDDNN